MTGRSGHGVSGRVRGGAAAWPCDGHGPWLAVARWPRSDARWAWAVAGLAAARALRFGTTLVMSIGGDITGSTGDITTGNDITGSPVISGESDITEVEGVI